MGAEDWGLKAALELCGAVAPPTYANVPTEAALQAFDVSNHGTALLWGDTGRVFLLPLFQSDKKQQHRAALTHVTLDPPLQPQETQQVECIEVNGSGSHVLLRARNWLKVFKLPNASSSSRSSIGTFALQSDSPNKQTQRFCVRFQDGRVEDLSVNVASEKTATSPTHESDLELVKKHLSRSSRVVVSVSRELGEASVREVGYFNSVRHAAWHPLSDTHVTVLSDAEELLLFNVLQDVSKPEQRHALDFHATKPRSAPGAGPAATTSSFCFGVDSASMASPANASSGLWDVFTCYLLRSDGAVFALCPLVPYDCRVNGAVLASLKSEVDAQITLCKRRLEESEAAALALTESASSALVETPATTRNTFAKGDRWIQRNHRSSAQPSTSKTSTTTISHSSELHRSVQGRIAELKSHKYWLEQAWAAQTSQQTHCRAADAEERSDGFRFVRPHVSGISPESWPLALQGPIDVTPKSVVEGNYHMDGGASATSILVIPSEAGRKSSSLAATPFLLRSFTSGHVELVLLDTAIRPQWKSGQWQVASLASRKLPALLLECLHLGINDSAGKAVLERDPADPRLVYCVHSTGVHMLNVSWVLALAAGKQFTSLPQSSVRHVFSVSPSASSDGNSNSVPNVVGARVVKNVHFGHLLLLRLASGNFEVVNVSAASSELLKGVQGGRADGAFPGLSIVAPKNQLPDTLASMASSKSRIAASSSSSSSEAMKAFSDIVIEKLEALATRGTRVSGQTKLEQVDEASLAFVIDRVKILYEDIAYIDDMDQLLKDRAKLHADMLTSQATRAQSVQTQMDEAQCSLAALQTKMDRALAVQQNLRKRAAAVLQAVKENQPQLSRAEREFKSDLDRLAIEVRRLKPRVTQLTVPAQQLARHLNDAALSSSVRSAGSLSDAKKKMVYDVLRAETQLIDDTKAMIEGMQIELLLHGKA